jgi:transitional endoplasmic reticulum ATPase
MSQLLPQVSTFTESPSAILSTASSGPTEPTEAIELIHDRLCSLWVARLALCLFGVPASLQVSRSPALAVKRNRLKNFPVRRLGGLTSVMEDEQEATLLALLDAPKSSSSRIPRPRQRTIGEIAADLAVRLEDELSGRTWRQLSSPELVRNVDQLSALLGLSEVEGTCLAFFVLLRAAPRLSQAANAFSGELGARQLNEHVALTLGLPIASVHSAMEPKSRLMASGLLRLKPGYCSLEDKIEWVSRSFADQLLSPDFDALRALRDRIVKAPPPTLPWEAFDHLHGMRDVTLRFVQATLEAKSLGVNILIYGAPGTGKTEFVRAVAQRLDCALFEVSTEDSDGDPIEGGQRLQALRVAQTFCGRGERAILLFDEVEDIFPAPHPLFGVALRAQRPKGWINRALETGPCVTFWLTNAPAALDPAISRRFSMVWELKGPPQATRESVIRDFGLPLTAQSVAKLSLSEDASLAVLRGAADVAKAIRGSLSDDQVGGVVEELVMQKLRVQRLAPLRSVAGAEAVYDPTLVNCEVNLLELAEGLRHAGAGRVCLYGPPGTGKSAYGQWLASFLGRPIHVKRASDLLSPLVGQAEKNIAQAFQAARDAGALLLIDEVDTFLHDRRTAQRAFEVSQVNEFLLQMEAFDGVFVATTNLLETTDSAAWRRFDISARFNPLKPEQAGRVFVAYLAAAQVAAASSACLARLGQLRNLALGDFAAVARQARFRPLRSPEAWLDALEATCRFKEGSARHIVGFSAAATVSP